MATIVRWNPFREMAAMQSAMDRLFEDSWRGMQSTLTRGTLALDIHESDAAYTVTAALPGLTADQIQVTMHDGVLTISAEVPQPAAAENSRVLLQERVYGRLSRSVTLPEAVDNGAVEATYENGVLTLTLPKVPEAQPRTIPVKGLIQAHNN